MAEVSSRTRHRGAFAVRSIARRLALACAAVSLSASAGHAAKLDEAACSGLKAERARIETEAIKSDMAKGPQWAKDNLTAERLKEIEQLINLEESIDFRCPVPRPAALPGGVAKAGGAGAKASDQNAVSVEAPAGTEAPPAMLSTPPAASATVKPVKPAKKPAVVVKQPSPEKADRPQQPKSTSKSSKTKPKVSDAYTPLQQPGSGEASAATSVTPLSP